MLIISNNNIIKNYFKVYGNVSTDRMLLCIICVSFVMRNFLLLIYKLIQLYIIKF